MKDPEVWAGRLTFYLSAAAISALVLASFCREGYVLPEFLSRMGF